MPLAMNLASFVVKRSGPRLGDSETVRTLHFWPLRLNSIPVYSSISSKQPSPLALPGVGQLSCQPRRQLRSLNQFGAIINPNLGVFPASTTGAGSAGRISALDISPE